MIQHTTQLPIAFLISSKADKAPTVRFLEHIKVVCPHVGAFMTDNDEAEINAIREVFPDSRHLLCWWHVLKSWRIKLGSGFSSESVLWKTLVKMLKSRDSYELVKDQVLFMAPENFKKYLEAHCFPKADKWAKEFRLNAPMFKETNTKMFVESYHNILKSKFFKGKRNHGLDKLIHILSGPLQDIKETNNNLT